MNEEQWRKRVEELLTSIDNQGYKTKELAERIEKVQTALQENQADLQDVKGDTGCLVWCLVFIPIILTIIYYLTDGFSFL